MSVLPTPEGPSRSMLAFSRVSGDESIIGAAPKPEDGGFRVMVCWWPGYSSGRQLADFYGSERVCMYPP